MFSLQVQIKLNNLIQFAIILISVCIEEFL